MTTYLVRLTGENFLMESDEGPTKKRFSATRLVEAGNPRQAEALAHELVQKDPRLQNTVLNDASDPPKIILESVSEVPAMAYDAQNRANAFIWEDTEK